MFLGNVVVVKGKQQVIFLRGHGSSTAPLGNSYIHTYPKKNLQGALESCQNWEIFIYRNLVSYYFFHIIIIFVHR